MCMICASCRRGSYRSGDPSSDPRPWLEVYLRELQRVRAVVVYIPLKGSGRGQWATTIRERFTEIAARWGYFWSDGPIILVHPV